jgi:hypothetical protein
MLVGKLMITAQRRKQSAIYLVKIRWNRHKIKRWSMSNGAGGMVNHPYETAILLLSCMYRNKHANRRRLSFLFNEPGLPLFIGGRAAEVNFENAQLLQVALYLRKHGASHLRSLSIDAIESRLVNFVKEQYHLVADKIFMNIFDGSYGEHLSEDQIRAFAGTLSNSEFFIEPRLIALFPLVPVKVLKKFDAPSFFLGAPADLLAQVGDVNFALTPNSFPPIEEWSGRREVPTAWLGVRAPTLHAARQVRAAVLGAVALLPHHMERYTFSGRKIFGGHVIFEERWSLSFGDPHTPPLMTDLMIGADDQSWLAELARKLASPVNVDRKHLRALEYYYRAWAQDPAERVPTLFAAIDAIFGDASKATQAVVDAVGPQMGPAYTKDRIRLMLGLRASVIHGGAPNIYESSKYEDYYLKYGADAVSDLELIVARCLQQVVFPELLAERQYTHSDLIRHKTGQEL